MALVRTITQLEKTLETERKQVEKGQLMNGTFGIKECIKSIKWDMEYLHKSIEEIYIEQINYCLTRAFHNTLMVIACEIIMKGE